MAGKKLDYQITVDSSQGITGVKNFSRTVQDELKKVEGEFDDTATAGERVATVLSAMARDLDTELDRAAAAADALSTALGPELAGKADVGSIVGDLQKMGLTFEEIVVDADKLAASLKELDQVQVKGLDSGLGGVNTKIGDIGKSAGSSRSVLANMVGNATQDLGALGGVAGSAGVAIGQMGEYMADAASEGDKLGTILTNFGKVAAPIAGIAVATQLITTAVNGMKTEQAFNAELVKEFSDALKEGESVAQELFDTIRETGELKFETGAFGGGGLLGLGSQAKDLLGIASDLGIGFEELQTILGDTGAVDRYRDRSLELASTNAELAVQYGDLADGVEDYQKSIADAEATQKRWIKLLSTNPKLMDELISKFLEAEDPIAAFPEQFDLVADAIDRVRQGLEPTPEQLKAITFLMKELGLKQEEVFGLGIDAADRQQAALQAVQDTIIGGIDAVKAYNDAVKAAVEEPIADAWVESVQAIVEADKKSKAWKETIEEIGVSLEEALVPFHDGTAQAEAFNTAFGKIGRGPGLATLDRLGDTKEAFQDIFQAVRDNGDSIPDIFATGSERAREFNDLLQQAAQTVGEDLSRVLDDAAGDFQAVRDRAAELREQFRDRFAAQFGLDLNVPEQKAKVDALVNAVIPTDKEIEVGIKLAEHDLLKLKSDLALSELEKLLPATALQIRVDLAEGDITPQEAAQTAQVLLDQEGLEIELTPHTEKADEDLIKFADKERTAALTVTPTGLDDTNDAIQLGPGGQGWPGIRVPVVPVFPPGYGAPSGGSGGPGGGPFLAPMALGAGPAPVVTSSGGVPGAFMVPVAAPHQQAPVVNLYTILNAGVIGDPFEVARAVEEGTRRNLRLMPVNP